MIHIRTWLAYAILITTPALATSPPSNAMLDLATCQGAVHLTQSLDGNEDAADRVEAMEILFKNIGNEAEFVPSDTDDGFVIPIGSVAVDNTTVVSFSPARFGIFKGPSVILNGTFDEVTSSLFNEYSIDFGNCTSKGVLKVCTRQLAPGLSRMIMSHPRKPTDQVVLVCVEEFDR